MVTWFEALFVAGSDGGMTLLAQSRTAWLKARGERHRTDQDADVKLEAHRDKLTFDLLDAARVEVTAAREEAACLRPMVARLAHLEEALDHIHALLHARMGEERKAAERRARAFLNRMRSIANARASFTDTRRPPRGEAALTDTDDGGQS